MVEQTNPEFVDNLSCTSHKMALSLCASGAYFRRFLLFVARSSLLKTTLLINQPLIPAPVQPGRSSFTFTVTFNGKLEFNPHVHALVTAGDLLMVDSKGRSNIYFSDIVLTRSWRRLVIALLRAALQAGQLKSGMTWDEVEPLLQHEESRAWAWTNVHPDSKEHFLHYGGRYVMRPPISENRILDIADGFVRFWYRDKKTLRQETVLCKVEEFIDRWAQHMPERYRHSVRYFGLFATRRWPQVAGAVFTILGTELRPQPKRLPWALGIQQLGGPNPLLDSKGRQMKFVRHLSPAAT
jgi:hypothetical protein